MAIDPAFAALIGAIGGSGITGTIAAIQARAARRHQERLAGLERQERHRERIHGDVIRLSVSFRSELRAFRMAGDRFRTLEVDSQAALERFSDGADAMHAAASRMRQITDELDLLCSGPTASVAVQLCEWASDLAHTAERWIHDWHQGEAGEIHDMHVAACAALDAIDDRRPEFSRLLRADLHGPDGS